MPGPARIMNWMQPIKSLLNRFFEKSDKKSATIEALVTGETMKTIQVIYKNRIAWLQKSLLILEQLDGNKVIIIIPHWLFIRKFTSLKRLNYGR